MKKYLLLIFLCAAGFSVSAQKKEKKERATLHKEFMNNCVESAVSQLPDKKFKPMIVRYCECSADKVLDSFSTQELIEFAGMSQDQMMKRVMPVIEGCVEDLTREIQEYMEKKQE